jgi:hypothetical protein
MRGSSALGPVVVTQRPGYRSPGQIEEYQQIVPGRLDVPPFTAAGTADSFFDVFFEIEVAGRLMYPKWAKRMSSVIDHKPPGEGTVYESSEIIPLVDAAGNPTGYSIGRTRHIPVPRDFVEVDVMPDTTALVQLVGGPLGNLPVPLILHGSSEAHVFFEGPLEGDAEDDDGDGRDDVATQLVAMNLTDGSVTLRLNPAQATLGQIEELVNNHAGLLDLDPFAPGDADSFFDVFFEIELPDGTVVHNGAPLGIQAVISEKPPLARYIHLIPPSGPIELLNANNLPTGVFLVSAEHYTGHIERDVMEQTTALLQLKGIPGSTAVTSFVLNGPSVADVYFEAAEGQARDDDGDGRDEVETELVAMNLTDGNITLRLNPAQVSAGQIEEHANATPGTLDVAPFTTAGQADSLFDVFFEIELPDGSAVHNQRPVRVQAVIDHKPPIARYIHLLPDDGPIELLDADNEPTGVYLVSAVHYTGKIEVDHFENSLAEVELIDPLGNSELVQLSGPSTAHVYFEGAEGRADDDNGNGRDEVAAELVQLDLLGTSSLGQVAVRLSSRLPSPGQIEETANATPGTLDVPPFAAAGTADSFFDVFFEIQVGNRVLYPARPKRISSVIDHKPPRPGTVYQSPDVIPLMDAFGRPTGFFIGAARHIPVPGDELFVERDVLAETTALIQLAGGPLGPDPVPFVLRGPAEAHVFFDGPREGDAADDDGDGRDEVQTELVSLNLTGGGVSLRIRELTAHPHQRSRGQIEELVNSTPGTLDVDPFAPGDAESFFDVFFEIELADGSVVHNHQPLRVQAVIDEKPPRGTRYLHIIPAQPVALLDENEQPTGVRVVQAEHVTGYVEVDSFPQSVALIELQNPQGNIERVRLSGPSTVHVFFEGVEGQAGDDDGDGRDEVATEMVQLDLAGRLVDGTPVHVRLDPARRAPGEIEDRAGGTPGILDLPPFSGPAWADSFFDVFFEIQMGSQILHAAGPVRMTAAISHKPPAPGELYVNPFTLPIALLDANGNDTRYRLVREVHLPNPDQVPPTVTIGQAAGQPDPATSAPIRFSVVFSEYVAGLTGADVSFAGSTAPGTLSASVTEVAPLDGTAYEVTVAGMTGSGLVVASIPAGAAHDLAGNPNAPSTSTDNTVNFNPPPTTVYRFDFGSYGSPQQPGFTAVIPQNLYTAAKGFGWAGAARVAGVDRRDPNMSPLRRDLNYARDGTFKVNVPSDGHTVYNVRVYHSNPKYDGVVPYNLDNFDVYAEGSLQYHVDSVPAGTSVVRAFSVTVSADGVLDLRFRDLGGRDLNFAVSGLEISAGLLPGETPLLADGDPWDGAAAINLNRLPPVVAEAVGRWSEAGLTADQLAALSQVQFSVADLGGAYLGLANPASRFIRIDDDAAGFGWSLPASRAASRSPADGRPGPASTGIDLFTVVMHELGHVLGYDHASDIDDLMSPVLARDRRLVDGGEGLAEAESSDELLDMLAADLASKRQDRPADAALVSLVNGRPARTRATA